MSDNDNTTDTDTTDTAATATATATEAPKRKGRTKKTPDQIREAYRKLTNALGLEGLQLFVNDADGRSVVLDTSGNILFNNISGTELVSVCERAYELTRYATKAHTQSVHAEDSYEDAVAV